MFLATHTFKIWIFDYFFIFCLYVLLSVFGVFWHKFFFVGRVLFYQMVWCIKRPGGFKGLVKEDVSYNKLFSEGKKMFHYCISKSQKYVQLHFVREI